MRGAFWLLGLSAIAVALALLMGQNGATVTLFWAPYRVDMSLNLVIAAVFALYLVVYMALRSIAILRELPADARRWRTQQRDRTLNSALVDALVHQTAGRYVRAKGSARQAIELCNALAATAGEWTPYARTRLSLAHLLAAEATHSLQDREHRSQHVEQALKAAEGAEWNTMHEAVSLRAVRWAVDDRHLDEAQQLLNGLPQGASRRTVALRIKLKLAQLTDDHITAFETARLLAKHKAFSAPVATSLLRRLRVALFTDCHDEDQLRTTWTQLERQEQRDPSLVASALQRLVALDLGGLNATASARSLALVWCRMLLETYGQQKDEQRSASVRAMLPVLAILEGDWLSTVERVQNAHAADPWLLLLAAETYHCHRLWGKAEKAFLHTCKQLSEADLKVLAWTRLAMLAEQKGQTDEALVAWKQAAALR